jgi:MFS family permease
MDKQKRPLGITALAFASVAVGTYCLVAAIALLLGGALGGAFGADQTVVIIAIGALYLGVMAAAYLVGYGLWTQRPWSWAGGIVVFITLIVASVALALIANNVVAALVPSLGAGAAIWYLLRPTTKSQLLGTDKAEKAGQPEVPAAAGALDMPQSVR